MNLIENPDALVTPQFKIMVSKCIHCGLCLQSCPTYAVFGTEMDSPRGRISLMRAVADERIEIGKTFEKHITLCLMCRACEQACPSGVEYGTMIELARVALERKRTPGSIERFVRWFALRQLMPRQSRVRFIAWWMRLYQLLGIQQFVRWMNILPAAIKNVEMLLPRISLRKTNYKKIAPAIGKYQGSVAFFHGCVQDAFLGGVNDATVRVLQRNGYDVHFPHLQKCCGAAQIHLGEDSLFLDLARQNIDSFLSEKYDAIINNAGGCGSTLKEYGALLAKDAIYAKKAKEFSEKVKDINEFLVENLHVSPTGRINARVTYSDSCHLRHVQKVVKQPRDLLKLIPGIELIELKNPDRCCGSAGVYNIVQTETSNAILEDKMEDIASTKAEIVVTTNTGCQLQLINGVRRAGLGTRVVHLVELLDQSYEAED